MSFFVFSSHFIVLCKVTPDRNHFQHEVMSLVLLEIFVDSVRVQYLLPNKAAEPQFEEMKFFFIRLIFVSWGLTSSCVLALRLTSVQNRRRSAPPPGGERQQSRETLLDARIYETWVGTCAGNCREQENVNLAENGWKVTPYCFWDQYSINPFLINCVATKISRGNARKRQWVIQSLLKF